MTDVFDYSEIVASADEILAEYGRQVTFIKTSAVPADPARPWGVSQQSTETTLLGVWAAVVPWMSEDDKDSVRYDIKMVIVSASGFPNNDGDLFDQMIDADGSVLHLHDANVVNPGGTRVLYIFRGEK